MKKLTYILCCALLAVALAVTAFASENAEMTLDTAQKTVVPGETVSFAVTLAAMEDCRSAGFTLSYDEAVFEFLDGSCSLKNALISSVKDGTGVFTCGDPAAVAGEIFVFRLKVKVDAAPGSYSITAKGSVRNAQGAVATKVSGATVAVAEKTAATTQTATPETAPADQSEPVASEATEPAKDTEPESYETAPVKGTQQAAPETPVLTIGAEPEVGFPWWMVAMAVAAVIAGIVFARSKKK